MEVSQEEMRTRIGSNQEELMAKLEAKIESHPQENDRSQCLVQRDGGLSRKCKEAGECSGDLQRRAEQNRGLGFGGKSRSSSWSSRKSITQRPHCRLLQYRRIDLGTSDGP
jgi:hypothetical protein